jgi:hypothetical protein
MSKIRVIAGDVDPGVYFIPQNITDKSVTMKRQTIGELEDVVVDLDRVVLQSEEDVKRVAGTAGWGLAGLALFGPLGAIGGMLIGGKGKDICFAAYLKDGRKFLATTDGKTYQNIAAVMF